MMTVVESPQARLRRELGLPPRSGPRSVRVDDYFPFRVGQVVQRKDDPRHDGVVVAVISNIVRVRWSNGWLEDCDPRVLEHVS